MIGSNLMRIVRTARHLRAQQVIYRLYYRLFRYVVAYQAQTELGALKRRPWPKKWHAPRFAKQSHFTAGTFCFLGEHGQIQTADDWNAQYRSKLWLYFLHYLDDLNSIDADCRSKQQAWLIHRWIQDNPPLTGVGWEPYPLSLRIVNLVKWHARQPLADGAIPASWLSSLARQAQALAAQEERHILANHLWANGKALVFAGAFFSGDSARRWLRRGLNIIDHEIVEQFLPDGGHFELSPMYHAALLWDICDLVHLARCCDLRELSERAPAWQETFERGRLWLADMSHPDGEISFFNDAAFGIAPPPSAIEGYAATLGCVRSASQRATPACIDHPSSGFVTVDFGEHGRALLDLAEVGASYQPGHAHADTLSFELSLFGHRVLVNSGTSQYGEDAQRQWQRSTAAHNTVEVDGTNSSEVWAGFRVARRAHPIMRSIQHIQTPEGEVLVIHGAHDGYRRLPGRPVHHRQWEFSAGRLRVSDRLSGTFRKAISRFYVHPDVRIDEQQVFHLPDGRRIFWSADGGHARIVQTTWHPSFGESRVNHCLEVHFDGAQTIVDFCWR